MNSFGISWTQLRSWQGYLQQSFLLMATAYASDSRRDFEASVQMGLLSVQGFVSLEAHTLVTTVSEQTLLPFCSGIPVISVLPSTHSQEHPFLTSPCFGQIRPSLSLDLGLSCVVPNRRIGGSGASTTLVIKPSLLISEQLPPAGRKLLVCSNPFSIAFGPQTPSAFMGSGPFCCSDFHFHHFSDEVPKRRIGGSGTSTSSVGEPSSSRYPFECLDLAYTLFGSCVAWVALALLYVFRFTVPACPSGLDVREPVVRHRPRRSRVNTKRRAPSRVAVCNSSPFLTCHQICVSLSICGFLCVLVHYASGLDLFWLENQSNSLGILWHAILSAALLCTLCRCLRFESSPLGRLAIGALGDIPGAVVLGFGQSFQHKAQYDVVSRPVRKQRCAEHCPRPLFKPLLAFLGALGYPWGIAMQPSPPLPIPLVLAGAFMPGCAHAMTFSGAEAFDEGRPSVLRPHEQPALQLANHVGPMLPVPQSWIPGFPDPIHNPPRIKVYDNARNPGTCYTETGEPVKWFGAMLYTPYMQPIPVALREYQPPSLQHYIDAILDASPGAAPMTYGCCVAVEPQRFREFGTFLRFPRHIKQVEGVNLCAVILDLTHVGGRYYACVLPGPIPHEDLMAFILPQTSDDDQPLLLYVGNSNTPHVEGRPVDLYDGVCLFVCRPVCVRTPQPQIADVIDNPQNWGPLWHMPIPSPGRGILVQFKHKQYFLPQHHHSGQTATSAAAEMFGFVESQITTCVSVTPGLELQGHACSELLMVVELPVSQRQRSQVSRRRDIFVLCDFRALGSRVWFYHSHVCRFHLPSLAALFGVHVPRGCRLYVLEGELEGDEVTVPGDSVLTFVPSPFGFQNAEVDDDTQGGPPGPPKSPDEDEDDDDAGLPPPSFKKPRHLSSGSALRHDPLSPPQPWEGYGCAPTICPVLDSLALLCRHFLSCNEDCFFPAWELVVGISNWKPVVSKGFSVPPIHEAANRVAQAAENDLPLTAVEYDQPLNRPPAGNPHVWHLAEADEAEAVGTTPYQFLVYAPDFIPDVMLLDLDLPCSVEHAMQAVRANRDSGQAACFDYVEPAVPQPDRLMAICVAAPSWLQHRVVVLINSMLVDSRLFTASVHPRLNRASLLHAAGLPPPGDWDVYVHGLVQPLLDDLWIELRTGFTISITPTSRRVPLLFSICGVPRYFF